MELRLPNWVRIVVAVSAIMQLGFGVTLLFDPGRIVEVWPWPLPPLTARILGASTLVSVPMALICVYMRRWVVAAIPFVMMFLYRLLQLLAGFLHWERFDPESLVTLNYFGGGLLMLVVFGWPILAGRKDALPPAPPTLPLAMTRPWRPPEMARLTLAFLGGLYVGLGLAFLFLGKDAGLFWFDAKGMTPLTARLFASPLIGLGVGLLLVSRAGDWRSVLTPAIGMITIGIAVTLAIALDWRFFVPQSPIAWFVAATPVTLFLTGTAILASRPTAGVSKEMPTSP